MATILVTGANGFVGSHVLPELLQAGHGVVALARSRRAADRMLERLPYADRLRVRVALGDVTNPISLPAAFGSGAGPGAGAVDAVVHLVAIPRDFNGGRDLRRVNTEGTRHVVEAAQAAGVRRLVHQSAMAVEDDPDLHYAASKAQGEEIVRRSGLDSTILKPSLLWGEGDDFFSLIARLARLSPGVIPVPGRGLARFQPFFAGDLARIVVACLDRSDTIGRTFELGGPGYWTYREITAEVLAALGKQRVIVPMPVPLISLVAGVSETLRLPFPVATDQLRQLRLDNIGPLDLVEREFGFAPRPMNAGLGYLRSRRTRPEPAPAG